MTNRQDIIVRATAQAEAETLAPLYAAAFPEEDLVPLVAALLTGHAADILSLGAFSKDRLVGHILFTRTGIGDVSGRAALLGPMCVDPVLKGQGIGTRLIKEGFAMLRADGVEQVMVLGDPAFYGRAGFVADASVIPPYALPSAWAPAWQMIRLADGDPLAGTMTAPDPWMNPALWRE